MEVNSQKSKIWISVLGIFLLGAMAGGFMFKIYSQWNEPRLALRYGGGMERMLIRLDLTPEQRKEVERILEDTRAELIRLRRSFSPQIRRIRLETEQELQKILTESQWEEFQELTPRRRGPVRRRHVDPEP